MLSSTRKRFRVLGVMLFMLALYIVLAYAFYSGLTRHMLGAGDFFPRWMGARALFLRGENPYSDAVTQEIQRAMYGRLARPDEDQVAFAYPLYAAFIIAPFVGLAYAQAQALWMALLVLLVVGGALLLARWYRFVWTPLSFAMLVVGVLLFYPTVRGVFLGQYALVSFFLLVLAFVAIEARFDFLGGALVALATIKPQPVVFFLLTLMFWAFYQRRWRIVCGAAITLGILFAGAMLWVPTWLGDFVQAVRHYAGYARVGPPAQTLVEVFAPRAWSLALTWVLGGGLIVWMVHTVWRARALAWDQWPPVLGIVAIVTTWTAVRIGTPDQVLLLIPWIYWLSSWVKQKRYGPALLATLMGIALPWAIFLMTLQGNAEDIRVTIVLPLLALVLYVWQKLWPPVCNGNYSALHPGCCVCHGEERSLRRSNLRASQFSPINGRLLRRKTARHDMAE